MQHTNSQCPHQRTYNSCWSSSSRWQRCCYQQMIGCCLRGTVIFQPISISSHVFHLNSEILRFRYLSTMLCVTTRRECYTYQLFQRTDRYNESLTIVIKHFPHFVRTFSPRLCMLCRSIFVGWLFGISTVTRKHQFRGITIIHLNFTYPFCLSTFTFIVALV